MKYLERQIGQNGAHAKYYFQEPHEEIDKERRFPTMVVCPGGAYLWTSFREDEAVALRFLAEGFHVAVVHYATEGLERLHVKKVEELPETPVSVFPNPLVELATAVAYLRENAEAFAIDTDQIIVSGYSAGGNLAAQLGTLWHEGWLEDKVGKPKELYRPTHLLLAYAALDFTPKNEPNSEDIDPITYATTGSLEPKQELIDAMNPIKHVTAQTPPAFIWHTREDKLVPSENALRFALELEQQDIPYELHLFDHGKHGLVLGDLRTGVKSSNENAQVFKWVDLFLEWLYPIKTVRGGFYKGR